MSEPAIPTETIIAASKAILRLEGWDVDSKVSAFHPPDALYQKYFEIANTALRAAGVPALRERIAELKVELAKHQESEFHPDWSLLEATRASLREHQEIIRGRDARIAELEVALDLARMQAADNTALTEKAAKYAASKDSRIAELEAELGEANLIAEARSVVGMDLLAEADQQEARIAELEAALAGRICEGCNALVANVGQLHLCGCQEQRNLCGACKAECACAGGE